MYLPPNEFALVIPSIADGTRPAAAYGTSVTAGNNVYGSYSSLIAGASLTHDAYGIWVNINSNDVATAARDALLTVGLDAAGGTSFTDFISHLLCSDAGPYYANSAGGAGGASYYFPVFIKAGTSIGAKASLNNVVGMSFRAHCVLFCKPTRPDAIKVGTFVQSFGATTASSSGTAVTAGTASEGAWTEIGTLDKTIWGWEYGVGCNDAVVNNNAQHTDISLGDATNKKIVTLNAFAATDTNERIAKPPAFMPGIGVSGDKVYARAQVGPNAAQSTLSICAYGVGG